MGEVAQTVHSTCIQDSNSVTCNLKNNKLLPNLVTATRRSENRRPSSCSAAMQDTLQSETACIDVVGLQGPLPSWTRPPLEESMRCCWSRSSDVPYGAIRECRPVDTCTPGSNKLPNGQRLPDCNSSRARSLSPLRVHTPAPSPSPPLQPLQPAQHNSTGQMRPRFQTAPSNQMLLPGPPALERWRCSRSALHQSNFARTTSTSSTDEALCSTGAAELVLEAVMVGSSPCTDTL